MTCLLGRRGEITHRNIWAGRGGGQKRRLSISRHPIHFRGQSTRDRRRKKNAGDNGPLSALSAQREAGTTKASLRPLSQHISHLSFDSFWVVLIISCSEMFAETLAERQEETMPSDKRTCHCALGTSKLSRYLIFFYYFFFFPPKV